ncbi:MAG: (2Fe-2S)-binding protein [Thermoanaerobaculia bacterium]|nr:(2Fe-2S)-binding protein [Thermoanaerobaculia bacterium]
MNDIHPAVRKLITVCRCNNIKFGTIDRAIEAGAKTVAEVAAKTTATTGRCGGSCTPRVLEMIETRWPEETASPAGNDDPEDAWWVRD